jgi:hypothetical protein
LSENYSQRFGQALFSLGINEFTNRGNPEINNFRLRNIHGDSDEGIIERMKRQLDHFKIQRGK